MSKWQSPGGLQGSADPWVISCTWQLFLNLLMHFSALSSFFYFYFYFYYISKRLLLGPWERHCWVVKLAKGFYKALRGRGAEEKFTESHCERTCSKNWEVRDLESGRSPAGVRPGWGNHSHYLTFVCVCLLGSLFGCDNLVGLLFIDKKLTEFKYKNSVKDIQWDVLLISLLPSSPFPLPPPTLISFLGFFPLFVCFVFY